MLKLFQATHTTLKDSFKQKFYPLLPLFLPLNGLAGTALACPRRKSVQLPDNEKQEFKKDNDEA